MWARTGAAALAKETLLGAIPSLDRERPRGYTNAMSLFFRRAVFFCSLPVLILACRAGGRGREAGPGDASYGPVFIAPGAAFSLLPPECIEKSMDMSQRISGAYGKNRFELNAWVRADNAGISMELFNDLGAGLGKLVFTGRALNFSSPYFPRNLKAEYAAADFQFCFYRPGALRGALGNLILRVEQTPPESPAGRSPGVERRLIYEGDRLLIEIEKSPRSVRYTNHLRGYSYTILGDFA
ncbi:MAG: DUF3261 domain-containing protein [Treponema sp.]|nr:DUF3261 domain-containing protein [Treponema sp.]